MRMSFTTKILSKDIFVSGIKVYDAFYSDFYVGWDCELEVRDWGIKSLQTNINNIKGDITFVDEDGKEEENLFDVNSLSEEWKIENLFKSEDLYPIQLDINYDLKTITIC